MFFTYCILSVTQKFYIHKPQHFWTCTTYNAKLYISKSFPKTFLLTFDTIEFHLVSLHIHVLLPFMVDITTGYSHLFWLYLGDSHNTPYRETFIDNIFTCIMQITCTFRTFEQQRITSYDWSVPGPHLAGPSSWSI